MAITAFDSAKDDKANPRHAARNRNDFMKGNGVELTGESAVKRTADTNHFLPRMSRMDADNFLRFESTNHFFRGERGERGGQIIENIFNGSPPETATIS
jgi:hypothetical protein